MPVTAPDAGGRWMTRTNTTARRTSSSEVEGITGRYFVNRKPKTSSNASYDTTAAARLWQASIDLAGMTATA